MIHDATVEVTCDGEKCRESLAVQPEWKYHNFSPSSGFYDVSAEAIEKKIAREGWTVKDGKHFCESCKPN